ncbi:MAG: alanine dehydrogenase, partial [Prochlorococcaceae cyanobacterium]
MAAPGSAAPLASPMASIGVPKEIKRDEQRVALTPDGARELVSQGMEVRIEAGAGLGAGIGDDDYAAVGA